jgi:hypothetical protein
MTLKEDFRMANMIDNGLTILEKYEKIADEFAIGFAEWLKDKPRSEFTKESLEIYKKEKGL